MAWGPGLRSWGKLELQSRRILRNATWWTWVIQEPTREHKVVLGAQSNSSPYLSHIPTEYKVMSVRFLLAEGCAGVDPTSTRSLVLITGQGWQRQKPRGVLLVELASPYLESTSPIHLIDT